MVVKLNDISMFLLLDCLFFSLFFLFSLWTLFYDKGKAVSGGLLEHLLSSEQQLWPIVKLRLECVIVNIACPLYLVYTVTIEERTSGTFTLSI